MDISKSLLWPLGFSFVAHASVGLGLSHWDRLWPQPEHEQEILVEYAILTEGEENEVQPAPTPQKPRPRVAVQQEKANPQSPQTEHEATESAPVASAENNAPTWEELADENANRKLQGQQLDASERYKMELRRALNQRTVYPDSAKRLRQRGRVLVRFILKEDGRLLRAEVVEPSSLQVFNEAAQRLIQSIDGLKPFPEELKGLKVWAFQVPIDYEL